VVFRAVTTRSDVLGYQHFGGPCCLRLQGEVIWHSEAVAICWPSSQYSYAWHHNSLGLTIIFLF